MTRVGARPRALDCTRCGACCFTTSVTYLRVFECDLARLTVETERGTVMIGGNRYMRVERGCCVALRWDRERGFVCDMYGSRPDVCRALQPGSSQCLEDRRRKSGLAEAWRDAMKHGD